MQKEEVYILAGDESVVSKAGKKTYGLDHFFSGLQQKVIPSLSFFVVSLVSVSQWRSYPVCVEQTVRSEEEKAACKAKKEAKRVNSAKPMRKRGRPTGSKNKDKSEVMLTPELLRIQKMIKALLVRVRPLLHPVYLAMDGHFGNYPAFQMVRQCGLHLISKLRGDAALCFPWDGKGHKCKYGKRVDYAHIPEKYLKSTTLKDGFQTCSYQAQLLHKDFPVPLNVVIIVKWLIDRVIVSDNGVESHYVVPTQPEGSLIPFCQLHSDYRVQLQGRQTILGIGRLHKCQTDCRDQRRQLVFVYGQSVSTVNVRFSTNLS